MGAAGTTTTLSCQMMALAPSVPDMLVECSPSHKGTRLSGPIISVLARSFPQSEQSQVIASLRGNDEPEGVEVVRPWWLVLRESVWKSWSREVNSGLGEIRILVLENVARAFGGERAFDDLVRELVSADSYYRAWGPQS